MVKKQTFENERILRFLRRFLKRQHGMLKIYRGITTGFEMELDVLKASGLGEAKLEKWIKHFEEFESLKNRYFKYFDEQATLEYAAEDIGERMITYSRVPKKDLVEILATTAYEHELMHREIIFLSAGLLFFQSKLSSTSIKEIQGDFIRQSKKKLKDEVNINCLRHSLETLKGRLSRPLKNTDLLQFYRVVEELYPEQPLTKKARLTKEEKELPEDIRKEILKDKQSNKWKSSSLRAFYERETGLKATTKKVIT